MMDIMKAPWAEKYRPNSVSDVVIPSDRKAAFEKLVASGKTPPNMIFHGPSGVGKTSLAVALLEDMGFEYIVINGSLEGRSIDTLNTTILKFASTGSFEGKRKFIILDEADYLNPNSIQPALRNFMEKYSKNCGFILTCNSLQRIKDALRSRCRVVDFSISKDEAAKVMAEMFKRCMYILKKEGVEVENKKIVATLLKRHFPDMRRVLNELQGYSVNGKIDIGILSGNNTSNLDIPAIMGYMKNGDFDGLRQWASDNSHVDMATIVHDIYKTSDSYFKPDSVPALVVTLAEYLYKDSFVADREINLAACLTEIMGGANFK